MTEQQQTFADGIEAAAKWHEEQAERIRLYQIHNDQLRMEAAGTADHLRCAAAIRSIVNGAQKLHTKGPWNIDPSSGLDIVFGDDGSVVAQALGVNFPANARLIAAAPEMLAALKVARMWSDADWVGYEDVTAAIAKANT